ncbi:PSD1 and planctomycete cytochrome C domain-containing protein [Blastopirellula sp. JC733]|nr:PSD1 and planctomycete cytochrome C domain-containing protein [Blastopirellula sediminis]
MSRGIAAALLIAFVGNCYAQDEFHFETDVRGIFKKHCFHCHGEEETVEGGLDLRLVRRMVEGGDSGSAIIAGKPDESLIVERLESREMPPDESKQLSPDELAKVKRWIAGGATTARPEPETIGSEYLITDEERSHWAYQPIKRPEVPAVQHAESVANPIDAFLLAKLEKHGHQFSPKGTPDRLTRRLSLDLLGLPPEEEWTAELQTSEDPAQWSKLVDQLLASPHYGERWGRHWLDVAGYADSEGYSDVDADRPYAWRYRDYVIRAFNEGMPFNQFIREQLAGDELISSPLNDLSLQDVELLAATGFLRMAPDGTGGAVDDAQQARNDTIADTIHIVSSSLMSITLSCAQCHDHRYDPISQADYFRFRAIFDPAFDWQKWKNPKQRLISLYTDDDRKAAAEIEEKAKVLDAAVAEKRKEFIQKTFDEQLAKIPAEMHELARAAFAADAKTRTPEQKDIFKKHPNLNVSAGSLYLYNQKAADELKKMQQEATDVRNTKPKQEYVRALTETPGQIPTTRLFYRGDYAQPKQELTPAGLSIVRQASGLPEIPVRSSNLPTSGRRLALADYLTDPKHPLTARAIMNRVWMHHFGAGLVTTPTDFGVLGDAPTHPELLDWLAAEFIESGWDMKHMHRLILNSNAWRQEVRNNTALQEQDPDNHWYGGARLRRLDAEAIRDSLLTISGELNPKQFGPAVPVMPDVVGRIVVGQENTDAGRPGQVIDMKGEDLRRSVYIQVRRSQPLSMMETFDQPAMSPNCDQRRPSTNATQSLMMLNSVELIDRSRKAAAKLIKEFPEDSKRRIESAWRQVYGRAIEEEEVAGAQAFVQQVTENLKTQADYQAKGDKPPARSPDEESLAVLCQVLLSSNEFLYVQ